MNHVWTLVRVYKHLHGLREYECKNCGSIGHRYPDETIVHCYKIGSCGEIMMERVMK